MGTNLLNSLKSVKARLDSGIAADSLHSPLACASASEGFQGQTGKHADVLRADRDHVAPLNVCDFFGIAYIPWPLRNISHSGVQPSLFLMIRTGKHKGELIQKKKRKFLMQRMIKVWNSLPQNVTDDKSLCQFKEWRDMFIDEKSIKDCSRKTELLA